ncbi:MAG: hypothetical protein Q4C49_12300 [Bacillota bacterium]|nr:hypothetical protein [Bacillota bacterium]
MNKLVKGIIGMTVVAAAGAAVAYVAYKAMEEKKKQEDLDDFLMGDEETVYITVPRVDKDDIEELDEMEKNIEDEDDIEVEFYTEEENKEE